MADQQNQPGQPTAPDDFLACLSRYFGSPEANERGATLANALLSQIQAAGRQCRFTGDDWRRLGLAFALFNVPGPLDQAEELRKARDAADRRASEESARVAAAAAERRTQAHDDADQAAGSGRAVTRDPPNAEQMRAAVDSVTSSPAPTIVAPQRPRLGIRPAGS
jgi:hypothetical protein